MFRCNQVHLCLIFSLNGHGLWYAGNRSNDSIRTYAMATLTVRNLDDAVAKQLRIRAAEHGRSAEAEHREILRSVLLGGGPTQARQQAADRLTEFRQRTAGRGSPSSAVLLAESRAARMRQLTGSGV